MISTDMLVPQEQIYNFLRSITIKFSPIAEYVNNTLIANGHSVNLTDPTTWKYYLNMVGEYHPTDTEMYVTSLDTRQSILFSPANLVVNPRTKSAYMPGGQYYTRLCQLYPSQVDLIKSILFPVSDIQKAITANDFTLLAYGTGYLEEWEEPAILTAIEKFLKIYVDRYYFDFLDDEPYFHITAWGGIWYHLASLIMVSRMEFIRTPYVHSWHIWQELAANGIANYSDILDRQKSMMLYQNIDYLKANAGKQSNLIILADNLLSDFGIGLYGRRVVQETATGTSTYQLTPQLEAIRIPTSYGATAADIAPLTVQDIQSEIYQLGLTPSDDADTVASTARALGDTTLNNFMTKFLEIRPITRNIPYGQSMSNFFMETLIVAVTNGYYTNSVEVVEPLTQTILYLTPAELVALYSYAMRKSLNIDNDIIPSSFYLYQSFLPTIGTPNPTFVYGDELYYVSMQESVNDFLGSLSYNTSITTPDDFVTMTSDLWLRYMSHTLADQGTTLEKKRAIMQYLLSFCHQHRIVTSTLVPGFTSYSQWLGSEGINIQTAMLAQYTSQDDPTTAWQNLALVIMTALIPPNSIIKEFSDLTLSSDDYKRLSQLFLNLCSYRIIFLESSPDSPDFTIGPKWSTNYGKIDMESFGEDISYTLMTFTDVFDQPVVSELRNGVECTATNHMQDITGSTLQTVSTMISNDMTGGTLLQTLKGTSDSSTTTDGMINLTYTRMGVSFVD